MAGFFTTSHISTDRPEAVSVAKCGSCGLYKGCKTPKMEVIGRGRSGILVVGESPDSEDDHFGEHFSGVHGDVVKSALRSGGVSPQRTWMTNAVICNTRSEDPPTIKQIEYCQPNLRKTLETLKPNVVITLGKAPLTSIVKRYWKADVGTLDRWVGWKIPTGDFWLCPTYHPAQLEDLKNTLMTKEFEGHIMDACQIEDPPEKPFPYEKAIEILYDDRDILNALRGMDVQDDYVAVDYETNCLKPEYPKARIYSCAVSNGRRTISFPWGPNVLKYMRKFLSSKKTKKIAANMKFEERWTQVQLGMPVRRWVWDTMVAAHCLDNRPSICSLKFQAFVRLGVPTYNADIEPYLRGNGGHYNRVHEIELRNLLYYGGMDSLLEYQLAMVQRRDMGYEN
jgi:uracil-DNA glycosylase